MERVARNPGIPHYASLHAGYALDNFLVRNDPHRHGRRRMSARHQVPIIPRPLIEYARWRLFERFLKVIIVKVAHNYRYLVSGGVRHQISEETNWIAQGLLRRLKPNDGASNFEKIIVQGKRSH